MGCGRSCRVNLRLLLVGLVVIFFCHASIAHLVLPDLEDLENSEAPRNAHEHHQPASAVSPAVLRLEQEHLEKIHFNDPTNNICLREITITANNSEVWRVVQEYGGWLGVRAGLKKIKRPPKTRSYLVDTDVEFLESSWCNRNGQWSTYAFVGPRITNPEREMQTITEWREDMREAAEAGRKVVYLATVPSILRSDEAPNHFFYNTHWFTVQLIPALSGSEIPAFVRIYAGFARHYRLVDYLGEWPQNEHIDPKNRLKMDRTTWAGTNIPLERFLGEFLDKSENFINEVNEKMEWTRMANDLHAELWYADKFKDMVILDRIRRQKNVTAAIPAEAEDATPIVTPYYERWRVPLNRPDGGSYHYEIRKYSYSDEDCIKYSREMRSRMYALLWHPAKPFKMTQEDYDSIY